MNSNQCRVRIDIKSIDIISGVCEINQNQYIAQTDLMPKKPEAELRTIDLTKDERSELTQQVQIENKRSELAQPQNVRSKLTRGSVDPERDETPGETPDCERSAGSSEGLQGGGGCMGFGLRETEQVHHVGYEVKHLRQISQRARVERWALGRMKREYVYNIFREEDQTPAPKQTKMNPRQRKELLARGTPKHRQTDTRMRIVVTGMSRTERRIITTAIKQLNGVVQCKIDKKTDCVVLGSCSTQCPKDIADLFTKQLNTDKENVNKSGVCEINQNQYISQTDLMPKEPEAGLMTIDLTQDEKSQLIQPQVQIENRSELAQLQNQSQSELTPGAVLTQSRMISPEKPRTVNALLGAVRGCRVVGATWVLDSVRQNRWVHHLGYEVKHLMKISQRARVERWALGRMKREYAYNIFRGMSVHVTRDAEQRDAILQLLTMCGAVLTDKPSCKTAGTQVGGTQNAEIFSYVTQSGGFQSGGFQNGVFQNGGLTQNNIQDGADVTIGVNTGEICSKWVFDSIAAARMRTIRGYINI